jgi:hypothetical protein
VVCGTLNGVALLLTPVRYSHSLKDGGTLGSMVGGLVLIGLVAGRAAYVCSLDYRRTVAVSETRREERVDADGVGDVPAQVRDAPDSGRRLHWCPDVGADLLRTRRPQTAPLRSLPARR